jgi:hypothetical protein
VAWLEERREAVACRQPALVHGDFHPNIILFEYTEAEMGNGVTLRVQSDPPLVFEHANTYAQLNAFDWSNG